MAWKPIKINLESLFENEFFLKKFKNINRGDQKNFAQIRNHINARIAQNSNLFSARRIYTEEKPYKCRQAFSLQNKNTKNLLFQHEETKRKKPYECKDCPKLCSP